MEYHSPPDSRGKRFSLRLRVEKAAATTELRLATLRKMTRNVSPGAELPEEPKGITRLARDIRGGGGRLDYFTAGAPSIDGACAEMIYWERKNGGRVFHAGAIAAGWALSADPKWQTVIRNVLHPFGVKSKRA